MPIECSRNSACCCRFLLKLFCLLSWYHRGFASCTCWKIALLIVTMMRFFVWALLFLILTMETLDWLTRIWQQDASWPPSTHPCPLRPKDTRTAHIITSLVIMYTHPNFVTIIIIINIFIMVIFIVADTRLIRTHPTTRCFLTPSIHTTFPQSRLVGQPLLSNSKSLLHVSSLVFRLWCWCCCCRSSSSSSSSSS